MRRTSLVVFAVVAAGCASEVSSEDRLDLDTATSVARQSAGGRELASINCNDVPNELTKARAENRPETDRLLAFVQLHESLRKRVGTFEEEMARNPDLQYQEGSKDLVNAKEVCVQQYADVHLEFEQYVRELVNVPTVQEIRGGHTVTIARLDFNALYRAIESLNPEDKDALIAKVSNAEKQLESGGKHRH